MGIRILGRAKAVHFRHASPEKCFDLWWGRCVCWTVSQSHILAYGLVHFVWSPLYNTLTLNLYHQKYSTVSLHPFFRLFQERTTITIPLPCLGFCLCQRKTWNLDTGIQRTVCQAIKTQTMEYVFIGKDGNMVKRDEDGRPVRCVCRILQIFITKLDIEKPYVLNFSTMLGLR